MKNILIVEDELWIRENLIDILELSSFNPFAAANGKEAFELLQKLENKGIFIDLILCDITMPIMDGYQFLTKIRAMSQNDYIPFIFLTAYSDRMDYRKGMNMGADDYITKPFTAQDILESIKAVDKKKMSLVNSHKTIISETRDYLTGLPIRNGLGNFISQFEQKNLYFYYIHIRQFYKLKELLDVTEVENITINVALRIKSSLSEKEVLVYIGEDSLLLLTADADFDQKSRKIIKLFGTPINSGLRNIFLSVDIGIAHFDVDETKTLNNAKTAVFYSINNDVGSYFLYSDKIEKKGIPDIDLLISEAFLKDKFFLESQPQIDIKTGKVVGVESLVRLSSEHYGTIYPDNFIWVCELNGLIDNLGDVVLHKACQLVRDLDKEGITQTIVAVNFSGKQLVDKSIVERVMQILAQYNIAPSRLEFEITETIMIGNHTVVREILDNFRAMGIKIALDDFGTGYSTFSYLTKFPVDRIKIDRSFITNINKDNDLQKIVKTIIDLAHDLNVFVVAEGVEEEAELETLKSLGCDIIQGYYFSKPKKFEELLTYIKSNNQK